MPLRRAIWAGAGGEPVLRGMFDRIILDELA